ncbi:hypothetical protein [Leptolyngbya sp. 7M]|uniref:hypothetical protein n=1 Tax=Leptolyngbya sp. 7M TaxID=2812896 RepID=UPI001B8B1B8A|nr:hypothetical protein [Leptolyngbya sp. 7M]QYO64944.1 hypothetical protein JVX88_36360 [Leptolyngbya sp. 7M]
MNYWWMAGLLASGLLLELGLRLFGFGNPLIYIADPQIGYLLAPNQRTRRLGKHIAINQYSMRSPNITATRPQETLRVLLLGDSIVNGGWWTDQSQTISALLQQQLQAQSLSYRQVEVLNASANSWAPIVGILLVTLGGTAISLERMTLQNRAMRQAKLREEAKAQDEG